MEETELLGIQNYSEPIMTTIQSLTELGMRFGLNLLVCFLIVYLLYFQKRGRKDYVFTFIAFSSAMLLLLYTMGRVDVGVGLTLGLFAIFGVIRYRTETVPIREMTYLFIIIALAAVNGLAPLYNVVGLDSNSPHYELSSGHLLVTFIANAFAVVLVWALERSVGMSKSASKVILYDRIDLILPSRRDELVADIERRCGVHPERIEIGNVDFLKDAAYVKIYYNLPAGESQSSVTEIMRNKQFIENQEFESKKIIVNDKETNCKSDCCNRACVCCQCAGQLVQEQIFCFRRLENRQGTPSRDRI